MAVVNDVLFVLVIKREKEEEDPEKKKEKEEEEEVLNGSKEAAVHEKLKMVKATTTTPTGKWNVDILKIIRAKANELKKRVEVLTFNNVEDAVKNQIENPRELSFMVVEQIFYSEIFTALKLPALRFIPCIIFSHSPPAVIREFIWNEGEEESKSTQCTIGIIGEFMKGIWVEKFATMRIAAPMRIAATKVDDALSTTEKTSSEEEEEEEPGDGEGQRGTRRRLF